MKSTFLYQNPRYVACLAILLCGYALVSGRSLYLDNQNGLDANAGTSSTAAWKNLSKVSNTTLQTGDTVKLICGGSWTGQTMTLKGSGAETNPIVVTSYGEGAAPQLGGVSGNGVTLSGTWIIVEKLCVSAVVHQAFTVNGQHNTLRSCEVFGSGAGANMAGQYGLVTNCYFHDLKLEVNTQTPTEDDYGAMGVWFNNSDQEVSNCRFIKCLDSSYDYGVDGGGVEVWAGNANIQNINVHHNYAYRCAGFFEMGGQGKTVSNIKVAYNVLIDCFGLSYVFFNATGTYAIKTLNYYFENNTVIVHECTGESIWTCLSLGNMDSSGIYSMRNNLFYVYNADRIMSGTTSPTVISNNLIYHAGTRWFENGYTLASTEISGKNPMVVNFGTCSQEGDYRLQSTSPAIDKGADLGYKVDMAGNAVPSGSAPDIGAYEYVSPASVKRGDGETSGLKIRHGGMIKKLSAAGNRVVLTTGHRGSGYYDINGRLLRQKP